MAEHSMCQPGRPLPQGLGQLGSPVTDLDDEQPGQAVEVALAVDVVDVGALAADDGRDLRLPMGAVPGEVQPQVVLSCLQDVVFRLRHVYLPLRLTCPTVCIFTWPLPSECVASLHKKTEIRSAGM